MRHCVCVLALPDILLLARWAVDADKSCMIEGSGQCEIGERERERERGADRIRGREERKTGRDEDCEFHSHSHCLRL